MLDTASTAPAVADPIDLCEAWFQINKRSGDILTKETATDMVKLNVGREKQGCPYEEPPKPKQRVANAKATS